MKFTSIGYDETTDACMIVVRDHPAARELVIDDDVVVGVDEARQIVHIDVHGGASERGLPAADRAADLVAHVDAVLSRHPAS